ncbi:MAG: hypothetical protein U0K57_03900 [Lachnospiraceae bacterium]|nr:hypothetical protein [Lachnospiraceae bacterium]
MNYNNNHGIDAFFPILRRTVSLQEAMASETVRQNMIETVEQVYRLYRLGLAQSCQSVLDFAG